MFDWVLVVADIRELEHPVWRSMGWRWCDGVWAVSSADWVLAVAVLRESEHPVTGVAWRTADNSGSAPTHGRVVIHNFAGPDRIPAFPPNVWAEGIKMRELPDIEDQRGLVSTSQLRTAGWSRSAISRFVRSRGWSPLPGVVYGHRTTLDDDQRVIAGWLWAGPASALTGGWGLVRHGLALAARPVLRRFVVADPCHSRVVDDAEVLHVHHAPTFRNLSGVPVACQWCPLIVP